MKIFIDGENFRHQITHSLVEAGLLSKELKNDFFRFDVAAFLADVLDEKDSLEIYYYTTKIKQPEFKIPKKLEANLERISTANRKWIAQLANQKIVIIKAGYLRVRESNACVHCGKKTLVLQEKGVDVRTSVDLLLAANNDEPVALLSSDSDLAPALQSIKRAGNKVIYVCPSNRVNRSLVAQSTKVVTFDSKKIAKYYKGHHEQA